MPSVTENATWLEWLGAVWKDPVAACTRRPDGMPPSLPHWRIAQALASETRNGHPLGAADFASIIRAVVRHHTLPDPHFSLLVPAAVWKRIDGKTWRACSIEGFQDAGEQVRLRARDWSPTWLSDSQESNPVVSPDDALYSNLLRRQDPFAAGDPMLLPFGYPAYHSTAQREAIRTILVAAPGSTIVVNLPTGSGKSLCALIPSLLDGTDGVGPLGVTPIVVPTISLAMDLDSKWRSLLGHSAAYVADDPGQAEQTKRRVASGNQGPLLISPESLVGAMRGPLLQAAKAGLLRWFFIDEAHMVTAWGDEFRPAFQQLAGLRRELLRAATEQPRGRPFVTVLMSATLTEYNIDALHDLFPPAKPGEFRITHAVRLRPEMAWWKAQAYTEEQRTEWLLDAVHHLPKPLILYTLKRTDAGRWLANLRREGFLRSAMIRGDTSDGDRRTRMQQWNQDELDIMVATSAFGLGVDKPNVRAVLHAALPEGLDRLYQDVGRGGRDGFPSFSLVIWHKDDWRPAAAMASPTFIGAVRGLQRWRAMFQDQKRVVLGDNRYELRVTQPPGVTSEDIDMDSEENEKWNRRTLSLMARSGLIEFEGGSTGVTANANGANTSDPTLIVRVLRPKEVSDPAIWTNLIEPRRVEMSQNYRKNVDGLREMLHPQQCVAHLLQTCYQCDRYEIPVVRACGGCEYCRSHQQAPTAGKLRPRHYPRTHPPGRTVGDALRQMLGGANHACIYVDPTSFADGWSGRVGFLARWLIREGIVNLVADGSLLEEWRQSPRLLVPGHPAFLYDRLPRDVSTRQPTAIFVPMDGEACIWREVWAAIGPTEGRSERVSSIGQPTVLVLPEHSHDPHRSDRPARQILGGSAMSLTEWERQFAL